MAAAGDDAPARRAGPSAEGVARALRTAIVEGRVRPGERLKELPLAAQLGVNRGRIREAIRLLEHDGLLRVVPNRGAVVPEVRAADVLEVYAMRAALGSLALHKLVLSVGEVPVDALGARLARLEAAVAAGDAGAAALADLEYQAALVAAAGLPRVAAQFELLTWQVRVVIATLRIDFAPRLAQMREEMRGLHAAVAARDAPATERLWREKLERWVRHVVDQLDEGFDAELWAALTAGTRPGRAGVTRR